MREITDVNIFSQDIYYSSIPKIVSILYVDGLFHMMMITRDGFSMLARSQEDI